jgi:hypothetical protein
MMLSLLSFFLELSDLQASIKWAEDQARLQKEQQYADRVAYLTRILTYPWSCITLALSPSLESRSNIPTLTSKSDESIEGQTCGDVKPTVSKAPYLAKSLGMVYLRRRGISKLATKQTIADPNN